VSLKLYMDVHIPWAITRGLRHRGVDAVTAQEDGAARIPDPELLDRATQLGRVLFTHDEDLLREAARRQQTDEGFAGLIYAEHASTRIGPCIDDLELIAKLEEPEDFANRVQWLPL
jgi:hypothetical protein